MGRFHALMQFREICLLLVGDIKYRRESDRKREASARENRKENMKIDPTCSTKGYHKVENSFSPIS